MSGIIATMLNDGVSPNTGAKLLRPETVKGKSPISSCGTGIDFF